MSSKHIIHSTILLSITLNILKNTGLGERINPTIEHEHYWKTHARLSKSFYRQKMLTNIQFSSFNLNHVSKY